MHEVSWKRNRKCSSMHVLSLFSGWGHKIIQRNISIFIRFCMCTILRDSCKNTQLLGNLNIFFVKSNSLILFFFLRCMIWKKLSLEKYYVKSYYSLVDKQKRWFHGIFAKMSWEQSSVEITGILSHAFLAKVSWKYLRDFTKWMTEEMIWRNFFHLS